MRYDARMPYLQPMPSAGRCTCCESEVDEQLVTAPRRDGSLQPVCRACRDVILGLAQWDELLASTRGPEQEKPIDPDLPPLPDTVRCVCGDPIYFVRPEQVGERGYFECRARRCGRRYRFDEPWSPGDARQIQSRDWIAARRVRCLRAGPELTSA